ncbi:MAG: hypothetical protein N3A69_13430, partial [Leptospiraceae bacterium]|nr:hypothetical protein [Leptospiraceae bacterium]
MKIGFIGNANNYPLMLARELRNLGYEIEFILAQNYNLDRPENKYPEYEKGYPSWMHNLIHWDVWNYSKQEPKKFYKAIEILSKCDLVVLNQYYICLAPYIQKPWISMITGTDLLTLCVKEEVINWYANPKFFPSTKSLEYKQYLYFALNRMEEQRFAIRNAIFFTGFPRGVLKNYDSIFDSIGVEENKRFPLIMIDTLKETSDFNFPSEFEFLNITITARLTWDKSKKDSTEIDYKGNDIFLKGFAEFIKKNPNKKIQLNLFKKGLHIQET